LKKKDIFSWIKDYYGISNDFPFNQLVTYSIIFKKINFISKGVLNFLDNDVRNHLNLISCGVKLFSCNKLKKIENQDFHCKYRICQDGVMYLLPYMTKRIVYCEEKFLIRILKEVDIIHSSIENEEFKKELCDIKSGCIVLIAVKKKSCLIKISF